MTDLDRAVAESQGLKVAPPEVSLSDNYVYGVGEYEPSTNMAQAMALQIKYLIGVKYSRSTDEWYATKSPYVDKFEQEVFSGETPMEAICRAVVALEGEDE